MLLQVKLSTSYRPIKKPEEGLGKWFTQSGVGAMRICIQIPNAHVKKPYMAVATYNSSTDLMKMREPLKSACQNRQTLVSLCLQKIR